MTALVTRPTLLSQTHFWILPPPESIIYVHKNILEKVGKKIPSGKFSFDLKKRQRSCWQQPKTLFKYEYNHTNVFPHTHHLLDRSSAVSVRSQGKLVGHVKISPTPEKMHTLKRFARDQFFRSASLFSAPHLC